MGIAVALLAALGYGLLELAFFAHRNQLLPWEASHFALGALLQEVHLIPGSVEGVSSRSSLATRATNAATD